MSNLIILLNITWFLFHSPSSRRWHWEFSIEILFVIFASELITTIHIKVSSIDFNRFSKLLTLLIN
jgi:hypothetical protein